jgi:hypothetical protein
MHSLNNLLIFSYILIDKSQLSLHKYYLRLLVSVLFIAAVIL